MKPNVELIYCGKTFILNKETAVFPDGRGAELEIIRHPGGVAIVALNDVDEVCLIRQYRHAVGEWIWELPAGRIEADEHPLDTAKRELAEEAGICAREWNELTSFFPSPGICDERIVIFKACQLTEVECSHEELEYIEIHWMPLKDALNLLFNSHIHDAKTIIGLLLLRLEISK